MPRLRLGVIELSRDFIESSSEIEGSFSEDALDFKLLRPKNLKALESVDEIHRATSVEIEPWTYDEIEAPTLALDPNADPKAKEKILAEQAGELDGLIFGHLRQHKDEGGQLLVDLYLRLFLKDSLEIFTTHSRWLQAKNTEALRRIVQDTARQTLDKAFGNTGRGPKPIWIFPKRGEGLEGIVRRCYGSFSDRQLGKLAQKLAGVNGIKNPELIGRDRRIRIPPKLSGKPRKTPPCQTRRP